MTAFHRPTTDPEPPVGTALQVGSDIDHITFHRIAADVWTYAHNGDDPKPCDYALVCWWGESRYLTRTYPQPLTNPNGDYVKPWLDRRDERGDVA